MVKFPKYAGRISDLSSLCIHEAALLGFWPINDYVHIMFVIDSTHKLIFPQFCPCRNGKLEIVKYLIEVQGCSAGCTDNSGRTPLHLACE